MSRKRRLFLVLLLASAGLVSPPAKAAVDSHRCLARLFYGEVGKNQAVNSNYEQAWARLLKHARFRAFLEREGIRPGEILGLPNQAAVMDRYFRSYLAGFRGTDLAKNRDRSILEALHGHGLRSTPAYRGEAGGYENLRAVSARNLARFIARAGPALPVHEEAARMARWIRFEFPHNTNVVKDALDVPLVSSRRLEASGIGSGLNTYPFNREFLKTDDQVFFFARPTIAPPGAPVTIQGLGGFGNETLLVNRETAREVGWISAYVMYDFDLQRVSGRVWGEAANAPIPPAVSPFAGGAPAPEDFSPLARARDRLWQLDFTVDDFEALIRWKAGQALAALARDEPGEFAALARRWRSVRDGTPFEIQLEQFLDRQVYGPLGLPDQFELKIPVAVEPEHLRKIGEN